MIFNKTQESFQSLYSLHSSAIQRFIHGMVRNAAVAEDLTQESFLKAWKALPQFGFKSSLKTWVFSVALNTTRDWLRANKHNTEWIKAHEIINEKEDTETIAVRESLSEVDEESRIILILHYYEELSQKEISRILQIPEGTVKSRLFNAKKKIREVLIKQGFDV